MQASYSLEQRGILNSSGVLGGGGSMSIRSGIVVEADGSSRTTHVKIDQEISTKKYMDPIHGYIALDQV